MPIFKPRTMPAYWGVYSIKKYNVRDNQIRDRRETWEYPATAFLYVTPDGGVRACKAQVHTASLEAEEERKKRRKRNMYE